VRRSRAIQSIRGTTGFRRGGVSTFGALARAAEGRWVGAHPLHRGPVESTACVAPSLYRLVQFGRVLGPRYRGNDSREEAAVFALLARRRFLWRTSVSRRARRRSPLHRSSFLSLRGPASPVTTWRPCLPRFRGTRARQQLDRVIARHSGEGILRPQFSAHAYLREVDVMPGAAGARADR